MKMTAKKLTIDEIRNSDARSYNPREWDKNVDRMITKYKDVVFYLVKKGNGYDYDRHFVEYTLPEGLRLLSSFSYGGALTSGGFYRVDKFPVTDKGQTYADLIELGQQGKKEEGMRLVEELQSSSLLEIVYGKFYDKDGNECLYSNSPQARQKMSELSTMYGTTFSKG